MSSLRVKVEFVLFLVLGLVVALGYGIQRFVILPGLAPLEQQVAKTEMMLCRKAIVEEVTDLEDDCAACVVAPPDIVSSDLLKQHKFDFLYVLDHEGRVLTGKAVDRETLKEVDIEEFPSTEWPMVHPLLSFSGDVSGVYMTSQGPAIVTSRIVPTGDVTDRAPHRLVAGRMLDRNFLREIYHSSRVAFAVWQKDDPNLPEDTKNAFDSLLKNRRQNIIEIGQRVFRVYGTYTDILGQPALLLQVDVDRVAYARAYEAMQTGLLAQVGIGLVALVVLVVLFRRIVMNSLSRLTDHTTAIGQTNDLSARITMNRTDEIGVLATEFNRMVQRLEEDVEQRERVEEALRESEERYALAIRGAKDGLWDWNLRTDEVYYSLRWKTMIGYGEEEIGDKPDDWIEKIHPEDRPLFLANLDTHFKGQSEHLETEHRIRHKDGAYLWVLCRGFAIRDENGETTRMAGSQTDITPRKRVEEQLAHQAFHDSLTTLPNRALLLDRLGQALRYAQRSADYRFAVLFLDLDRFKVVNDGLGHLVGDKLLKAIAERLNESLRGADTVARCDGTVARFGGDEFVILLDNIRDASDATRVAERIQESLAEPFHVDEHEVFTSVSIGIALSTTGYDSPQEFLRNADTAMYRAKARGKACYEVFDSEMHAKAIARLEIETDLRRAIEREEFVVFYQPIVSLTSGAIESFEALVRWEHPVRGLVCPDEFIPVAEETGMIIDIGKFVLQAACHQARAWQIKLPQAKDLTISVNLSAMEVVRPDLLESVEKALMGAGLSPSYLNLEITESVIMEDVQAVQDTLARLRTMGITLSIDDFGTGHSSLSYLHRFPLNTLKIDRAFVRDMHVFEENMQIVRTILMLAANLNMKVIAEGIESLEQLDELRNLSCDCGQGFFFSPPVPGDAATAQIVSTPDW